MVLRHDHITAHSGSFLLLLLLLLFSFLLFVIFLI